MEQSAPILQLNLINIVKRPMCSFIHNDVEILALFDSGALIPVWCTSEKAFLKAYPEAELINKDGYISGFGEGVSKCKIYKLPVFELSNGNDFYRILNLHVAVCQNPEIGCSLVMSDTMFSKTDTLIKRRGNKMLEIFADKNEYQCTFQYLDSGKLSISVWTQS